MRIESVYHCEKCEMNFNSESSCRSHEKECGVMHSHICDKCGKETLYSLDDNHREWYKKNEVWTFRPNHFRAGYGSKLDSSEFVIHICDDCLYEFVKGCKHKERIVGSGSGAYYDLEEDEDVDDDVVWDDSDESEAE